MQDVNLLQGLVRRVGDCRGVRDDHRVGLKGVRSSGSIIVRVFMLSNGEVGFAVVQPRQVLLEPASSRGPSRELAIPCSVALQTSVCFSAGLTSKYDARGASFLHSIIARRLTAAA